MKRYNIMKIYQGQGVFKFIGFDVEADSPKQALELFLESTGKTVPRLKACKQQDADAAYIVELCFPYRKSRSFYKPI